MSLPRSPKLRFVVLTRHKTQLLVLSKAEAWLSHWDQTVRAKRRCGGETCALCALGVNRQYRYVLLCLDRMGQEVLLELTERHAGVLEEAEQMNGGIVGSRLVVQKLGDAKNSPISVRVTGREQVWERSIVNLVACFGLEAQHVSTATSPLPEKAPEGLEDRRWTPARN